jgi:SAM-dependent methyltransferase
MYCSSRVNVETKKLRVLEIGGAGGITKNLRPNWTVTDIRPCTGVDLIASASRLPFESNTFDMIYGVDVLHHLNDLEAFFEELERLLKKGGCAVFREPYWSFPAQIVWRFVHPEEFSLSKLNSVNSFKNPMEGNQALAWMLLKRNSKNLAVQKAQRNLLTLGIESGLAFLLSGGANFTTKLPSGILWKIHRAELKSASWLKIFGFSVLFAYNKN